MEITKKIKAVTLSSEGWLYIMILFAWAYPLLGIANAVMFKIPGVGQLGAYAQDTLLWISIILSLRAMFLRLKVGEYLFYGGICVLLLIEGTVYPENAKYIDEDIHIILVTCVPLFYIGFLWDAEKLMKPIFYFSCAMIVYRFYHDIFYVDDFIGTLDGGGHQAAMWQAYTTLPYVLYVWWYSLRKINIVPSFFSVLGLFLIISYGNRGSLVSLTTFVTMFLLFFKRYKRKWLAYSLIVIIASLIIWFSTEIVLAINFFVEDLGMSTRVLDKLLDSDLLNSDDRDILIDQLRQPMSNMGFFGYGLYGSFPIIGIYPHKIHYDLWISFGYAIGTAIMIALAYIGIRAFLKSKSDIEKQLLLLFLILGIEPLLFSFSFTIWPYFFMYIGYCVGRIKNVELKTLY